MSDKTTSIPLSVPNLGKREWKLIKECLDTNWISSAGGFVEDFEQAVSKYLKVKYATACINGTAGLFIALKILGIKSGNEVIVPTLTFIAPVNAVRYVGAEPVFMDCDDYMNMDVDKLHEFCKKECTITKDGLRNKKTRKIIKAILPVHVFGNPCNMEAIIKIAKTYKLKVVEDAAESIGSFYTKGVYKNRFTGTIGDVGVYSFNGNKVITSGSGGMIVTNNKKLACKAKYLINQAKDDSLIYIHNEVGYNFRLTNLQAAIGLAQLERLNIFVEIKRKNYNTYKKQLEDVKGIRLLGIQENTSPNHWFYPLVIDKKIYGIDSRCLMRRLALKNIDSRPIWRLNHTQRPYRNNQCYKIEKASRFLETVLNIPCSTGLRMNEIKRVVNEIRDMER